MYPHNLDDHGNLKPGSLRPSHITLTAYGDSQIKRHGTVTIPCSYEVNSTDIPRPAIIGRPTSTDRPEAVDIQLFTLRKLYNTLSLYSFQETIH